MHGSICHLVSTATSVVLRTRCAETSTFGSIVKCRGCCWPIRAQEHLKSNALVVSFRATRRFLSIGKLIRCGRHCTRKNRNLPQLGQGPIDFKSFDEVLTHAAGTDTCVSRFIHESTGSLRRLGHGAAAVKYGVNDMYDKLICKIDVFDWTPGIRFGHLFFPCITAE